MANNSGGSGKRGRRLRGLIGPTLAIGLVFALIGVAACAQGDDDDSGQSTAATGTPATGTASPSEGLDLAALPLGDGNISLEPEVGSVYSCQVDFPDNAGGALVDGPWIDDQSNTWSAEDKVAVPGEVYEPSEFDISLDGDTRTISGNDLPDEPTGEFPVGEDTEAYEYDRNPNQILAQQFEIELPAIPEVADEATCTSLGAIGVLIDGAYFFNALDGPGRDAVAHEIQDECDGHPERSGAYHYHSLSVCVEDAEPDAGSEHSPLVGYAIDGFGIYGHYGEDGETLTNTDLDECHGHTHEVEWDGENMELFHYHSTFEYPYTVGCFRGTPAEDEDLGALDPDTADAGASAAPEAGDGQGGPGQPPADGQAPAEGAP